MGLDDLKKPASDLIFRELEIPDDDEQLDAELRPPHRYEPGGVARYARHRVSRRVTATYSLVPTIVSAESSSSIAFDNSDHCLFRGDFLYLDCDGLLIESLTVGNRLQPIGRHTPCSYYNENRADGEELAKAVEKLFQTPPNLEYEAQRRIVDRLVQQTLGQAAKYRGRPVKLDTREVGHVILLSVYNPTKRDICARGTLEGQAVKHE